MFLNSPKPTEAELEILQVLWRHGPCTVRDVNDQIKEQKPDVGYTTTLKLMQIMTEKGLVKRDTSKRQHIYVASIPESTVQEGMVKTVIDRLFQGSPKNLIMHALGHEETTLQELEEIKKLIKKMEAEQK